MTTARTIPELSSETWALLAPSATSAVLLAAARPAGSPGAAEDLLRALVAISDWPGLQAEALQQGMGGLLARRIIAASPGWMPADVRAEFVELRRNVELRALRMVTQLLTIDGEFRAAAVPLLWLKGPVLSVQLWQDPGVRVCVDLDALVLQRDVPRARDVLERCGFEANLPYDWIGESVWLEGQHDLGFVHRETKLSFELHWRVGPRFHEDSLPAEMLLEDVTQVPMLGRTVTAPSPASATLIQAVHAAGHEWDRVEQVAVMAELLAGLGYGAQDRLGVRAAEHGCSRRLHIALLLAHHLAGASVSPGLLRAARRDETAKDLAAVAGARLLCLEPANERRRRSPGATDLAKGVLWQARGLDSSSATLRHLWRKLMTPAVTDWPTEEDHVGRRAGGLKVLVRRQKRLWAGLQPGHRKKRRS